MGWTTWILASAFFLAVYDVFKKTSVRDNAVLPVLTIATLAGAIAYIGGLAAFGDLASSFAAEPKTLLLGAAKSVIVGTSWILTYNALRTLPVTIASPIRSSAPALVILVAFFLYGERPSACQWLGMTLVFIGFFAFSWAGKAEGIDFLHSRAVWSAAGGMVLSAVSALFDKYVFQIACAPIEPVQFYFQVFLFVFYSLLLIVVNLKEGEKRRRFDWRWTIPFTGITLAGADWLYFHGLAIPDAPISVAALLRRFSVALTFIAGAVFFKETNLRRKLIALILLLVGTAILCLG